MSRRMGTGDRYARDRPTRRVVPARLWRPRVSAHTAPMDEKREPRGERDNDARRAALLSSPLFDAMRPDELDSVLQMAVERRVHRGQTIFQKGDDGTSLMAVLSGRVRISAVSADGKEVTLNVIDAGDVFGELALLDGKPRSADAVAIEDTVLLVLERRRLLPFLQAKPDLLLRLLAVMCGRLRRTSVALEELALFELPVRLARVLGQLAEDYGRPALAGTRIEFKLSQRDLSTLVAASRESVNKQLRAWQRDGLLALDAGYIVLRQPAALRGMLAPQ
jgi:CRP/FNR family cyclic AMP-dependent transcriptional regulator